MGDKPQTHYLAAIAQCCVWSLFSDDEWGAMIIFQFVLVANNTLSTIFFRYLPILGRWKRSFRHAMHRKRWTFFSRTLTNFALHRKRLWFWLLLSKHSAAQKRNFILGWSSSHYFYNCSRHYSFSRFSFGLLSVRRRRSREKQSKNEAVEKICYCENSTKFRHERTTHTTPHH